MELICNRRQVNKFLSALSAVPQPTSKNSTPVTKKFRDRQTAQPISPSSINAESSTRQFDAFIRSISKLRTLGEARRLRADVEREQRFTNTALEKDYMASSDSKDLDTRIKSARRYIKRLDRAKVEIDTRIAVLTRQQGTVSFL
jgi:sorting nexin-25